MALITITAVVHIALHTGVIAIRLVFLVAVGALEYRIIIGIRMTRGADAVRLAMGHRKACVLRVIEGGSGPCSRVVAVLARRWEKLRLGFMARIGAVVVVRLMAPDTLRGQRRVIVVDVTIRTGTRWGGV